MTRIITSILFVSAILLTAGLTSDYFTDANALKSQGTGVNQYGSATSSTVCGDKLCSEYPGGKAAYEAARAGTAVPEEEEEIQVPTAVDKHLENILAKLERGERLSTSEMRTINKMMEEETAQQTAEEY